MASLLLNPSFGCELSIPSGLYHAVIVVQLYYLAHEKYIRKTTVFWGFFALFLRKISWKARGFGKKTNKRDKME
jgi:hypothetical protein